MLRRRRRVTMILSVTRAPNTVSTPRRTTLLVILDGFGHRTATEDNAIFAAQTPNLDRLRRDASHTLISGSGPDVGLPEGQMGNSEVGHMSLGAGRIVHQSITRIDQAIANGEFEGNPAYVQAIDAAVAAGKAVHVMGLLSPGGVHSHEEQLFAALRLAASRGAERVYLHAFLDGRDTPPRSAAPSCSGLRPCSKHSGLDKSPPSMVATGQWIAIIAGSASKKLCLAHRGCGRTPIGHGSGGTRSRL